MPYMLAPGARLYVGPGGKMEESLGACCSACAAGGPCASSLGAAPKSLTTRNLAVAAMASQLPAQAGATASAVPTTRWWLLLGGAAVVGVGGVFVIRKLQGKRRRR